MTNLPVPLMDGNDADFQRRWPPEQFPALYLGERECLALRRRERRRRELLNLIGPDLAEIAAATVMEDRRRDQ